MMFHSWYGQSWGLSPAFAIGIGAIGLILAIIVIVLKGYALWHAAKRDEKWWFIILLVVNTVGILELIYLIFVVKKWSKGSVSAPTTPPPASTPQM